MLDYTGDARPRVGIAAFHDNAPEPADFLAAALDGLERPYKAIPCRFLYDDRGSALFDRICELPEYYLTRTEMRVLADNASAIAAAVGPDAQLIELGSGSCDKIAVLLDRFESPWGYVPIDISRDHLLAGAGRVQARYPRLWIEAICADYAQMFDLPPNAGGGRRVAFYPGSTIGNLDPADALAFLSLWAERLRPGALMIVGVDLRKSKLVIEAAYDDAQGVTAQFSLNLLARANRELGADFDLRHFEHRAVYDGDSGRVRIDLVSRCDQHVHIAGTTFAFARGEPLHVEDSWKYAAEDFQALARGAGFRPIDVWADEQELFSVHLLAVG